MGAQMRGLFFVFLSLVTIAFGSAQETEHVGGIATKIKLIAGSATITGTLNDSVSARDLISQLPSTVRVSRSSVDFCGVLPRPLKSDEREGQAGWKNGDISYIPGADWIAFFFGGEAQSTSYGKHQHIVGNVDDLSALDAWPQGSFEVRMELY